MSLINREALLAEYDRVHVGEPGNARKLIVDAPTVEPERKWIPVTERLPKNDEKVLVTVKNGEVLFGNYHGKHWAYGSKVLAWMPLPEPYREGEQDE